MTRINTNVGSLRGLRNLNSANSIQNTALERLSTGTQINSGKDNPSGLIAGEKLRLQVTTIEQSIKNSNRASNVIATADAALGEIGGLLNQIRGLVQEGLNSGALSDTEIEANQLQIDTALDAINRISSNTTFAGDKLIDGSKAYTTQITSADAAELSDFQVNSAFFGSSSSVTVTADVNQAAERGILRHSGANTQDVSFEIGGKEGNQVFFFDVGTTQADVVSAVNAVKDATGVEASITTTETAGTATLAANAGTDTLTFTESQAFSDTIRVVLANGTSDSGTSVSVSGQGSGTTTVTVELADTSGTITATTTDLQNAINNDATASALLSVSGGGSDVLANADLGNNDLTTSKVEGVITFQSTEFGSDSFVEFNVLSGDYATVDADGNSDVTRDAGLDIIATINGSRAQGSGLTASVKTATLDASLTFTSAANSSSTSTTINVTGGGSNFQIGQEVSASGQLGIGIEAVNTARLGGVSGKLFELGSGGGKSLLDVGPNQPGSDLVDIVDEALDRVSTVRGRLGAIQKNVIETNVSALGVALENISEARSQIVDTDFASETAKLTQSQILSQAGISVLSIANQQPQQVLALLG